MSFADLYIIDPLETVEESLAYCAISNYEYIDIATEGSGNKFNFWEAIKNAFIRIRDWFQRRWQTLVMKLKIFKQKKNIVAALGSKKEYRRIQSEVSKLVADFQKLRKASKDVSNPNIDPITFKKQCEDYINSITENKSNPSVDSQLKQNTEDLIDLAKEYTAINNQISSIEEATTAQIAEMTKLIGMLEKQPQTDNVKEQITKLKSIISGYNAHMRACAKVDKEADGLITKFKYIDKKDGKIKYANSFDELMNNPDAIDVIG